MEECNLQTCQFVSNNKKKHRNSELMLTYTSIMTQQKHILLNIRKRSLLPTHLTHFWISANDKNGASSSYCIWQSFQFHFATRANHLVHNFIVIVHPYNCAVKSGKLRQFGGFLRYEQFLSSLQYCPLTMNFSLSQFGCYLLPSLCMIAVEMDWNFLWDPMEMNAKNTSTEVSFL